MVNKIKYDKGLVKIIESDVSGRCDKCHRPVKNPIEIKRGGKLTGRYGPKCSVSIVEATIKANENNVFGFVFEGLEFIDYFKRPEVGDLRKFERVELTGYKRVDIVKSLLSILIYQLELH